MSILILPDGKEDLAHILYQMLNDSKRMRAPAAIEWYIAYHYLRGSRYFDSIDYRTGEVAAFYEDTFGQLPFRFDEVLCRYNSEVGRLMRLDISPSVQRNALGLQYASRAAVAHVTLDTLARGLPLDKIKLEVAQLLCLYGTVGCLNWVLEDSISDKDSEGQFGKSHILDIVPPWELLPLPANPVHSTLLRGIAHQRWVPYDWLKKDKTAGGDRLRIPAVSDHDLQSIDTIPGYVYQQGSPESAPYLAPIPVPARGSSASTGGAPDKPGSDKMGRLPYVELSQVWIPAENQRLARYTIMAGKVVIYDHNFERDLREGTIQRLPIMPISTATYYGGLGFYGKSFVTPLISLNAEVESSLLALFRNVQDMDQFGYLFYPESWGIPRDAIEEAKPGKKVFAYRPDPVEPGLGVQAFQPKDAGAFPGQMADKMLGLIDRLSQQPTDLMAGNVPGRMESAKGVDLLFQTSAVPLGGPALSLSNMFSDVYRSVLWNTRSWKAIQINTMSLLDDMVMGVEFDPQTGAMSLAENSIPDPFEVNISIKSKEPVNLDSRKQELLTMLQAGIITAREFRIINRREGLGLPTGNNVEWQNYVRAVINSILMFNDGKTPGKAFYSDYDLPAVHEYVILCRMSSPEFALAEPPVQAAFRDRLLKLRASRGALPDALPQIEEAAAEAMQAGELSPGASMQGYNGMAQGMGGLPPEQAAAPIHPGGGMMMGPGMGPAAQGPAPAAPPPDIIARLRAMGG